MWFDMNHQSLEVVWSQIIEESNKISFVCSLLVRRENNNTNAQRTVYKWFWVDRPVELISADCISLPTKAVLN